MKNTKQKKKFNRLRRLTRSNLNQIARKEKDAFDLWLASHRPNQSSQQDDLPSSLLPSKMSQVSANQAQLFAIIDTCSIVKYRSDLMEFVVNLKKLYSSGACPIKLIISLVVLEELDKCNRPKKRAGTNQPAQRIPSSKQLRSPPSNNLGSSVKNEMNNDKCINDNNNNNQCNFENEPARANLNDIVGRHIEPPRMFMRFVEEELRVGDVLISDLDPFRRHRDATNDPSFEIVNNDDRILDCCLRSMNFVGSLPHHEKTRVILVTEDNVFKSKATTFGIASFRWHEFKLKFKNFGMDHYASTPISSSLLGPMAAINLEASPEAFRNKPARSPKKRRGLGYGMTIHRGSFGRFALRSKAAQAHVENFKRLMGVKEEAIDDSSVMIVKEVISLK